MRTTNLAIEPGISRRFAREAGRPGMLAGRSVSPAVRPAGTITSAWRRLGSAARHHVRLTPATSIYMTVLVLTTIGLRLCSPALADRILVDDSTNLHNMTTVPLRSLVGSALVIDGNPLVWGAVVLVLLGLVERRFGTRRSVGVFAAGHVIGTLVSLVVVWHVTRTGGTSAEGLEQTVDVGVSYGAFALAGFSLSLLRPRWRWPLAGVLGAYLGFYVLDTTTFTQVGHFTALLVGVALWARLRRPATASPPALAPSPRPQAPPALPTPAAAAAPVPVLAHR